jgi:Ca2+-binding RTX toxin-like protein
MAFPPVLQLSALDGSNGFQHIGEAALDRNGRSIGGAGDVNGDGFADLISGSPGADANGVDSGAAYVIFGSASGFASEIALSSLDGSNGFKISGEAADDRAGRSVAGAGDVNGDGFADVIVGAYGADPNGALSGASYVLFGKASGFAANVQHSDLDGANGFKLNGDLAGDKTGYGIAAAGDVNGDGFDDVVVGALDGASRPGAAFVVFGKASGFGASVELSALDGSDGFRLSGVATADYTGSAVAGAGDVNGDGFADFMIGACGCDSGGDRSGSTYVVFGVKPTDAVLRSGTGAGNRINGGLGSDSLKGLGGNDTLIGWEAGDQMSGGAGNDTLAGGTGNDTLIGGAGADAFEGGDGRDRVSYAGSAAVLVDLDAPGDNTGDAAGDTFASIEEVMGSNGNDILRGADAGSDRLFGGNGDDSLAGRGGDDLLSGGEGGDTLDGGDGDDTLQGVGGADSLLGGAGDDKLQGGNGNDTLIGGAGRDTLTGGADADTFVFLAATDSGPAASTRDAITDFVEGEDLIDFSAIDADGDAGDGDDAFTFIAGTFTGAGAELRAFQTAGGHTVVAADVDGDRAADFQVVARGLHNLDAGDFVL